MVREIRFRVQEQVTCKECISTL